MEWTSPKITLSMQIPGHTMCLVDAGFSSIIEHRPLEISLYIYNLLCNFVTFYAAGYRILV